MATPSFSSNQFLFGGGNTESGTPFGLPSQTKITQFCSYQNCDIGQTQKAEIILSMMKCNVTF